MNWFYGTTRTLFLVFCLRSILPLEAKQIQFNLVPEREDIIQYEIELWKTDDLELEIPFRVLSNPGPVNLFIPEGYEFFRIRAVAKRKVRGYWTELYNVSQFGKKTKPAEKPIAKIPAKTDILVPIANEKGNQDLYLTSNKIKISSISLGKKNQIRYRINGGIWQTSSSPELEFFKDGSYQLEYKVTNELGISDGMQLWDFKVDRTPPKTVITFPIPPFIQKEYSFIGPNYPIQLKTTDNGSGVSTIRYRTTCDENETTEYYLWNDSTWKEILSSCNKTILLEISAVDRLGNEESPKKIFIHRTKQD